MVVAESTAAGNEVGFNEEAERERPQGSSTTPPRRSFAGGSPELDAGELHHHHVVIFPKQEASPSSSFLPIAPLFKLKVKNKQASLLLVLHQPATLVGVVHITEIETPGQGEVEYGPDPVVEETTVKQQGRHLSLNYL
nr:unnamed protein product [Digitaria exilis]